MIKFSQSTIHEFQNLYFFCGKEQSTDSSYLYKESSKLFGKEILAPNLLEYQKGDEDSFDYNGQAIKNILSMIKIDKEKFISLVDVRLGIKSDCDIKIYYDQSQFSEVGAKSIQSALTDYTKFDASLDSALIWPQLVKNIDFSEARYIQIEISENFVNQRSSKLSSELSKSFDSTRYVDSQIACFMLMTMISGSSQKFFPKK